MKNKTMILITLLAIFLCIASFSSVSAQPLCDHNVTVLETCCNETMTEGWFYNGTGWNYSAVYTPLLHLMDNTDETDYYGFCINYTLPINETDTFNASVYVAEPTCKNNSIAYILNNWTIDCNNCSNVSAGQSAVWYFWYINDTFCGLGTPQYNHTAIPDDPDWESYWIPNSTAHQNATDMINASINQSVPYAIVVNPNTGSYAVGEPIPLNATVDYCLEEHGAEVTVVFETDNGTFENNASVFENETIDGIARATLTCDNDTANVTARVKDMKWFEIVEPCEVYQETLRIINITDDANFSFFKTPDIGIVKLVDDVKSKMVVHSQTVTFTLNVTNTGNATLNEIMVNDTLPAKLTFVNATPVQDSATPNADGTTTIIWQTNLADELEPGNYTLITFNATIDPDAETGVTYTNRVTVNATSDYGDAGPKDDSASVYLRQSHEVPVLTPFGIAALIGLLGMVAVLSMSKGVRKKRV